MTPFLSDRTDLSPDQIHYLLLTCVSSSCFQFQDKFYEQTAGISMGSPISMVLADIFMETLELSSLLTADLRPSLWLRYVDDDPARSLSLMSSSPGNQKANSATASTGNLPRPTDISTSDPSTTQESSLPKPHPSSTSLQHI